MGADPYRVSPPPKSPRRPPHRRIPTPIARVGARVRARERRYPIWSARAVVAMTVVGFALTAVPVLLLGKGGLVVKMEVTLGVVAAGLFVFLTAGLYAGARVRKREEVAAKPSLLGMPDSIPDVSDGWDLGGSADDGPLGCLLALLGLLLLPFVVVGLFVLVANVGLILFFLVALSTGWLFHRALRQVFAKSRRCRGDLAASLLYAAWYTLLYTGWLFAVLVLAEHLTRGRAFPA
ncbi:MAG: hypothetical protein JWO31_2563 [Phycisphaerales bacterium]|nr:hypothetical protein [Phycisphaerales bacterium]